VDNAAVGAGFAISEILGGLLATTAEILGGLATPRGGLEHPRARLMTREDFDDFDTRCERLSLHVEMLMRALERRGNVAEAIRVYEGLRVRLRDELGTAPSSTAQELHARLLRSEPANAD
jgi:hypothetical protein